MRSDGHAWDWDQEARRVLDHPELYEDGEPVSWLCPTRDEALHGKRMFVEHLAKRGPDVASTVELKVAEHPGADGVWVLAVKHQRRNVEAT